MEAKFIIKLYLRSNSAEAIPPLGTTLGNLGINALKFCKDFNEFTKELPTYFLVAVEIVIYENKSYTYKIQLPSIGSLISLLKKEDSFKDIHGIIHSQWYITLEDWLKLALFILPEYPLKYSLKIIQGFLLSSNVSIKI